ncbi:TRAP transporter substrate-binding protein [Halalkalibacter krulwichiae]|uniref:2,3-diketo-L-gulonate-binding periplasmic protein YiaO n=1 Tax=Halalkalibacter krulwichiae TaxID=199441 RepID=A0A1X9MEJ0_9BACI|nr:TRAP transporter substrate-binding protein [Halalkalibacter krulwichiae]ARK29951.1 2,3-diketo-L-gulonate-binding periplasmic protein YiaO precursor [Halalkalibacter krulwichiae]
MKKNKALFTVLFVSMLLLLAACGGNEGAQSDGISDEQTYNFRVSLVTPPSHGWTVTAEKFNEELQARSDGRMSAEVFPSEQLGSEADMVQQMEIGSLDFGFITNAYMSTRSESLNAWFMPFLFENLEEASQVRQSEEAKQMLAELESQGLVGLDFSFAGERHVLMKSGAIEDPSDLAGKKLRIIGNPVMQEFWTGLGVSPTPMPLGEVYSSLQTGVIDGIDIDLDALVSLNLQEIADDLTLTKHMAFPSVVVMSQEVFNSLSAEDQEIVKEAMQAAVDWGVEDAIQREESNLAKLQDAGLTIIDNVDTSAFTSVQEDIYSKYSSNEIINSFIESNQ